MKEDIRLALGNKAGNRAVTEESCVEIRDLGIPPFANELLKEVKIEEFWAYSCYLAPSLQVNEFSEVLGELYEDVLE
ncbi:GL18394 [Drosophila persimilis]|uniref:GL18394 n=1 Tax=Drosophila persimilis TaxID=7234 RepID=B4H9N5_DROPE|nr:GL18394 [Drosophila persimilis]